MAFNVPYPVFGCNKPNCKHINRVLACYTTFANSFTGNLLIVFMAVPSATGGQNFNFLGYCIAFLVLELKPKGEAALMSCCILRVAALVVLSRFVCEPLGLSTIF